MLIVKFKHSKERVVKETERSLKKRVDLNEIKFNGRSIEIIFHHVQQLRRRIHLEQ